MFLFSPLRAVPFVLVDFLVLIGLLAFRFFTAVRFVTAGSVVKKRSGTHEDTIREFQLTSEGLKVSDPLTEFNGILTGTPTYVGGPQPLLSEK